MPENFWKTKPLADFNENEWESICTHCGKCCQIKLEDDDSGDIFYTNLVCRYFDTQNCSCTCYQTRCQKVPNCLKLTPINLKNISWIPEDCAYNILQKTGDLPNWHPLVTGKPLDETRTVKGSVISETSIPEEQWEDYIIEDEKDNDGR